MSHSTGRRSSAAKKATCGRRSSQKLHRPLLDKVGDRHGCESRPDRRQMRILILGGDGYLGWPTAMAFSNLGDEVMVVDNLAKRQWEAEVDGTPLEPVPSLRHRVRVWQDVTGKEISVAIGDIAENQRFLYRVFSEFQPEAI